MNTRRTFLGWIAGLPFVHLLPFKKTAAPMAIDMATGPSWTTVVHKDLVSDLLIAKPFYMSPGHYKHLVELLRGCPPDAISVYRRDEPA